MPALIMLSVLAALVLIALLPLLFAELMVASLNKLHLSGEVAALIVVAIVLGGFVNIPVRRVRRSATVIVHPWAAFGIYDVWPRLQRVRQETVIAVNLGGCIVPVCVAAYEIIYLAASDVRLLGALGVAAAANVLLCFRLARMVPGVGIALPALVPPLISAALALLLAPEQAPPVAFVAGCVGPLVGADLLHLRKVEEIPSGVVSIGGAGTFDGIILSGIIAAYLA
jgi:uncharacterized membrane protein